MLVSSCKLEQAIAERLPPRRAAAVVPTAAPTAPAVLPLPQTGVTQYKRTGNWEAHIWVRGSLMRDRRPAWRALGGPNELQTQACPPAAPGARSAPSRSQVQNPRGKGHQRHLGSYLTAEDAA